MAAKAFKERNLEPLVHLGNVKNALDVCLAQFNAIARRLGATYDCLAKGRSFLLGLLADRDLFLDRGGEHTATVLRQNEGWKNDDGSIESADVANHGED